MFANVQVISKNITLIKPKISNYFSTTSANLCREMMINNFRVKNADVVPLKDVLKFEKYHRYMLRRQIFVKI